MARNVLDAGLLEEYHQRHPDCPTPIPRDYPVSSSLAHQAKHTRWEASTQCCVSPTGAARDSFKSMGGLGLSRSNSFLNPLRLLGAEWGGGFTVTLPGSQSSSQTSMNSTSKNPSVDHKTHSANQKTTNRATSPAY